MKFRGTIVITDPCYIMKKYEDERPKFSTWGGLENVTPNTQFKDFTTEEVIAYKEYEKALKEYNKKYNDWAKCDCGRNMEVFGFTNYITEDTIFGDWSCKVYNVDEPKKAVEDLCAITSHYNSQVAALGGWSEVSDEQLDHLDTIFQTMIEGLNLQAKTLGQFCADAGLVSVFLLDEVLAYNPDFLEWAKEHPWCVAIIEDFDGEIEYYVDTLNDAHIIGIGNINFFSDFGIPLL